MKNLLTDTYTPMEIDGKIVVVVDMPDPITEQANSIINDFTYLQHLEQYNKLIKACIKYETLEQDAPYWKERIGQRVEVDDFTLSDIGYGEVAIPKVDGRGTFNEPKPTTMDNLSCSLCGYFCYNYHHHNCWFEVDNPEAYAIPPQQKQDNEDLWDEVQSRFNAWLFEDGEASLDDIFNDLKSNYSLKRKL